MHKHIHTIGVSQGQTQLASFPRLPVEAGCYRAIELLQICLNLQLQRPERAALEGPGLERSISADGFLLCALHHEAI